MTRHAHSKIEHRPSTACACGHAYELHLPTCTAWLGKGAEGADKKGFCACAEFRLKGRKR